ncbi:hypothetical protein EYR40_008398 [Pleurotus pulmonarius]|nr:hypothetical protein EYR40_008398 [Pleurotus pulmonarius]
MLHSSRLTPPTVVTHSAMPATLLSNSCLKSPQVTMSIDQISKPAITDTPVAARDLPAVHESSSYKPKYQYLDEFLSRLHSHALSARTSPQHKQIHIGSDDNSYFPCGPRVTFDSKFLPFPSQPWELQTNDICLEYGVRCSIAEDERLIRGLPLKLVGSWFVFASLLFLTVMFIGAGGEKIKIMS